MLCMLVYGGSASSEQIFFALLPRALCAGLWQWVVFGLLAALLVEASAKTTHSQRAEARQSNVG